MAIDSSDYLAVYQTASGQIRKATVGALLANSGDESLWKEDGTAVTPKAAGADLTIEGGITADGNISANEEFKLTGGGSSVRLTNNAGDLSISLLGTTGSAEDFLTIEQLTGSITAAGRVTSPRIDLKGTSTENILAAYAGTAVNGLLTADGKLSLGDISGGGNIVLDGTTGGITAAGKLTVNNQSEFYRPTSAGGDGPNNTLLSLKSDVNSVKDLVAEITCDGSATFKGDVAIGNSASTFLNKAAVIAALTPEQRTTFAAAITAWNNRPEPYDAEDPTTLPADIPLREAIVRVTTAGKINLNSDGSITAGGGVRAVNGTAPSNKTAFVQIAGSNDEGLQISDGTDANIKLSWDGTITAAGKITANHFDLESLPLLP